MKCGFKIKHRKEEECSFGRRSEICQEIITFAPMNSQGEKKKPSTLLLTGWTGMLGGYIMSEFSEWNILKLGRGEGSDVKCDLEREEPKIEGNVIDLVVHCAGTEEPGRAESLNRDGTAGLLNGLKGKTIGNFVYISSTAVYGREEGERIDETEICRPSEPVGKTKLEAEQMIEDFFEGKEVPVTILRPGVMFGKGIKGGAARMFSDVVSGKYLHIRGNEARLSVVTAYDVARAIKAIFPHGGIYNITDGRDPRWSELAEGMSANAGRHNRMTTLPAKWAAILSPVLSIFPGLRESWGREILRRRSQTLTFSSEKLVSVLRMDFFDTVEVIARRDEHYPYVEE